MFIGKEDIARIVWIGLNQLYSARGWEWSDHKPLNFLNWDPGKSLHRLCPDQMFQKTNVSQGAYKCFKY
jgi:hypothetical protein